MDAIFEQSPIPMAVARMPDAVLVVVNPASRETLKLETDLVGKSLFTIALDWKTLTPDGREVAPENIPLARAIQGETILKELLQIVRKDGSTRWIEISAGPIYGKQGTQIAAQAAFPDITERKNAEEALAKALRENKILLRELQHRAKNSFAMLSGMIKLAERSSESHEEKTVLNEIGSRVRAVSELYDLLYSENSVTEVRLDTYFSRIAASLPRISKNITLNISCDTISATVKTAIPTGIIITELMTNSIKHAFPGNRSGSISLSLEKTGDGARIQVIDDGIGLPDGLDISTVNSMGLSVVRALVEQVSGSSRIERSNGTRCIVEFPIEENTEE
ncbi:MAG: PAS domain S-box protein [bacterium]|nr:PAS domain S-box protein [bacterium]